MKNKRFNTIIFKSCALLLCANAAQAQEWQVNGGAHFIKPQSENAIPFAKNSEGFSVGLDYNHYLNKNFSIGLGYLNADLTFAKANLKETYMTQDFEGDNFEFRYKADYYEENVKMHSVRIPLTIQFETQGIVRWYMRTGIVYDLQPTKAKYKYTIDNLSTSGYYEQWDAELYNPLYAGFGDFGRIKSEGSLKMKNNFSWIIESGIKQQLGNHNDLYLGMFFELGLNDIRPESTTANTNLIHYTSDINNPLQYNSLLNEKLYNDKKLSTYTIGFKLRYAFDFENN